MSRFCEVDAMRAFLIFLLLADHSFAPFSGIWDPVSNQPDIPVYYFFSKFLSSLFLQVFVFISGYIYGAKLRNNHSNFNFRKEVVKKFNRLIIPSFIFSLFYCLLFEDLNRPFLTLVYNVLCGCGHLWFLPMLFWCFVFAIIIEHYKWDIMVVLPLTILISLLAFIPLPFQMNVSLGFFFYFFSGFYITRQNLNMSAICSIKFITIFFVLYFLCYCATLAVNTIGMNEEQIFFHISRIVVDNMLRVFYSIFGVLTLYLTSVVLVRNLGEHAKVKLAKFAGYCFGIYIFQQFVLKYLYYKVYSGGGIYLLPWAGVVIAGIASLILTIVVQKLPYGKKLIG